MSIGMKKNTGQNRSKPQQNTHRRVNTAPNSEYQNDLRQNENPNVAQKSTNNSTRQNPRYEQQNQMNNTARQQQNNLFSDNLREEYEEEVPRKSSIPIVPIILICLVVVVIVAVVCIYSYFSKKESTPTENTQIEVQTSTAEESSTEANPNAVYDEKGNLVSENGVYDLDGNVIDKDADDVGLPNFSDSENGTTTERYFSSNDFVKDLNGLDIPAVYNVKSRSYIKDFVNYDAKRAIIDEGMELYWLEVTYKNKKYRVQCPFYIFKDLDDSGICVVEIEVLNLEGGEKVISWMQVVQDYDDLINND